MFDLLSLAGLVLLCTGAVAWLLGLLLLLLAVGHAVVIGCRAGHRRLRTRYPRA